MGGSELAVVRVLGPAEVTVNGSTVDFDTRKAIGVLAYLVVEGSASRDTLMGLFWPDSSPDRARATLRRTLSSLRSGAGAETIEADRDRVELASAHTDLAEFKALLDSISMHGHDPGDVCHDCVEPLTQAAKLYRGEFLHGFTLRGAPYFEEWERGVSETLRRQAGDVFRKLAAALASSGDYARAITAVNRWIEVDPLHEPAHRQAMLLHAWSGDRPGAIDAYREFVAILDRELAVSPLAETSELYEAILDEDLPPAPGPRREVSATTKTLAPIGGLVGRSSEVRKLAEALEASGNTLQSVVISGQAWMGKTRMIEEVTQSAAGRQVLAGRAHRSEATLPYGLIAQLLQDADADALPTALPQWVRDEVGRIVPHFGSGATDSADPLGEIRLLEALQTLFSGMATHSPLLVTVDDVQWIDNASARALSHILDRLSPSPVMVVLTCRTGEPIADETRDLLSRGESVALLPLQAEELPEDVPDRAALIAKTGGIPVLIAEHLSGRPESDMVERYLSLRLDQLSELGEQVLGVASVVVSSCSHPMIHEVSGRSEDEVVDALDELTRSGMLREVPGSQDYAFSIDAAAENTYDALSLARRRLLHRRAAEMLAAAPRATSEMRTASLAADHFYKAVDSRAGDWFRIAGDLARRSFAHEEAGEYYETALALGTGEPCALQISLAEVKMAMGDYERALVALDLAAGNCEGPESAKVEHLSGEVHRILGRFDLAASHFERAASTHPEPARVYADWALLAHRTGHFEDALLLGEKALQAAQDGGTGVALSHVHNVNGVISATPDDALRHLNRAVELANGDDVAVMAALNNKARIIADDGDLDTAENLITRAIDLAAKTGHRHREAALRDFLADLHHRSGDVELSRATQTEAMALFADIDRQALEPEIWLMSRW